MNYREWLDNIPNKYKKKITFRDIGGGETISVYLFDGFSNQDLAESLKYWEEKEDYEYCSELIAEASLRGITINNLHGQK